MMRVAERRREQNKPVRSAARTWVKKVEQLIFAGDIAQAQEDVKKAYQALDKAAKKRVFHPNKAARYKSRLMRKLNAILAPSA